MGYESNPFGQVRDGAYVSEIAGQRPALATRHNCTVETPSNDAEIEQMRHDARVRMEERDTTIRGSFSDDRSATFNEQLREK